MSFQWPLVLPLLLLVPIAVGVYVVLERRRAQYAVRYTNLDVLASVVDERRAWRRWVPPVLFFMALAAALLALARPQVTVAAQREGANVILTIDSSGSMFAKDVPPTRLGAAQEAVRRFLEKLPDRYRVGVVTFSSEAQVVAPLTRDRQVVRDAVDYLYPGRGTAIGDALARSVELARGGTVTETGDRRARAGGAAQRRPRRPGDGDPHALRRRADCRHPPALRRLRSRRRTPAFPSTRSPWARPRARSRSTGSAGRARSRCRPTR